MVDCISSDNEDAITPEDTIHDKIWKQLECFKDNAKMPFLATTDEYSCPLNWWLENWTKQSDVWDLAEQICISQQHQHQLIRYSVQLQI